MVLAHPIIVFKWKDLFNSPTQLCLGRFVSRRGVTPHGARSALRLLSCQVSRNRLFRDVSSLCELYRLDRIHSLLPDFRQGQILR